VSGGWVDRAVAGERSLLMVLAFRDDPPSAAVSRLARELAGSGAEHVAPRPLGAEGMREIRAVRGRAAASAPVGRVLEASGGLSQRIHEDVAGHAGRRSSVCGVRAGGAAARRGELHELEGELAASVVELHAVR
jgi:hypothetical protein